MTLIGKCGNLTTRFRYCSVQIKWKLQKLSFCKSTNSTYNVLDTDILSTMPCTQSPTILVVKFAVRSSMSKLAISVIFLSAYQCLYYQINVSTFYQRPGPRFNIKMSSYQHRKSHCGDKTAVRSSYLHNRISYTGNMASLYWFSPQIYIEWIIIDNVNTKKSLFYFIKRMGNLWWSRLFCISIVHK